MVTPVPSRRPCKSILKPGGLGAKLYDVFRSAEASSQPRHVIYPAEAEGFVRELRTFKISDIGSEK